ncbi:hypothetical protein JVX93_21540 [Mycolicibacterium boenickei]|nr:hypothetical protein JVX93_21540 [Mycolicibacterium boenickei]
MINSYPLEVVAAAHLPQDWKNPVRWLKERLAAGEIPGKELTRGVWVMTDKHIEKWLEGEGPVPVKQVEPEAESEPTVSLVEGLSRRSHARIVRSA